VAAYLVCILWSFFGFVWIFFQALDVVRFIPNKPNKSIDRISMNTESIMDRFGIYFDEVGSHLREMADYCAFIEIELETTVEKYIDYLNKKNKQLENQALDSYVA
jgi:hypothetical protein